MNIEEIRSAKFLVGSCADHSPAFSKKTLFVKGKSTAEQIDSIAKEYNAIHIHLGFYHSFHTQQGWTESFSIWNNTISKLLNLNYYVTLEHPSTFSLKIMKLLNKTILKSKYFIPMAYIRISNIEKSHPNLTLKIDDENFGGPNGGVWCYNRHEMMDSNKFSNWNEYDLTVIDVENEDNNVAENSTDASQEHIEAIKDVKIEESTPVPETILSEIITPEDAANIYVGNVTDDPLNTEPKKKILKVKK